MLAKHPKIDAVFCENDTFDWYRIVIGPADETNGDVSWCASEGTIALALFESDAQTFLVPMVSDGVGFQPKPPIVIKTPLEGDQMLSPSSAP